MNVRRSTLVWIFLAAVFQTAWILFQTPYPPGSDGYIYLKQISNLLESGHLHFKDLSLIYPLGMVLLWIFKDPVSSYQLLLMAIAVFFSLSFYRLAQNISKDRMMALILTGLSLLSMTRIYTLIEFPKTMLAVSFFLWVIYFRKNLKDENYALNAFKNILGLALACLAAVLSHKFVGFVCVFYLMLSGGLRKKYLLLAMALLLSFLLGAILLRYIDFSDGGRLAGLMQFYPALPAFSFFELLEGIMPLMWKIELLIFVAFPMLYWIFSDRKVLSALAIMIFIFQFPFFQIQPDSVGFRLFLIAQLVTPLLGIGLIQNLNASNIGKKRMAFLLGTLFLTVTFSYPLRWMQPPYELYEKIFPKLHAWIWSHKPSLIIVHKPLAEMISFREKIDTLAWEVPLHDGNENIWRIMYHVPKYSLERNLESQERKQIDDLNRFYALIPEKTYQKYKAQLIQNKDQLVLEDLLNHALNPTKSLPVFLKKLSPGNLQKSQDCK